VVSWRWGVVLLGVLVALAVYLVASRPRPAPQPPALVPCGVVDTVYLRIEGGGRTLELQRPTTTSGWDVLQPLQAPGDPRSVEFLVNEVDSLKVLNTISTPQAKSQYGLDEPAFVVNCRLKSGRSYNLTVGRQSFDGSGYYAQKGGDNRVFIVSSVEVDGFDKALSRPPVKPTPSPQ
jgi:Domain of unknown function (DUF4340)